jgi:hypothetical protein
MHYTHHVKRNNEMFLNFVFFSFRLFICFSQGGMVNNFIGLVLPDLPTHIKSYIFFNFF